MSGKFSYVTEGKVTELSIRQPCHRVFQHLSEIATQERSVKVISFADEGIFNNKATDIAAMKTFVFSRTDMNYPIYIDSHHVAYNGT